MPSPSPRSLVLLIALAATLYLVGNARVSLWDRDEPRYAQTSRQMLQTGDWVVPRFLDKVRTAKPVFIYWCQAASMAMFGRDGDAGVFAARLPSVIAMTLVLALVGTVLWRAVSPAHAFWAVLILSTSVLAVWSAKACTTDAVLLLGITAAQLCLYNLWRGRSGWPVVVVLAVAVAQAGLTKGPVVLGVTGSTLLALTAFRAVEWLQARRVGASPRPHGPAPLESGKALETVLKTMVCLILVAVLVGPWLYFVQQREAKFLGTSVWHDVFTRIIQPLEGHSGPPGYHLALIFATFLPWSALLPMAIVFAWKHRADLRLRFALAAVLGPWALFEIVQTKLPHYMLPAFPPLALLTADAIVRGLRGEVGDLQRKAFHAAVAVTVAVFAALGLGTVGLAIHFDDPIVPPVVLALTTIAFVAVVLGAFFRHKLLAGLLALGVGVAAVYAVVFGLYLPHAGFLRVSPRVAEILHRAGASGGPDGEAIMLDYKEPSLAFYQGGTIREHSAMALSHDLLDRAPRWLVMTDDVWASAPVDVQARMEIVGSVSGLAYADGRTVDVRVVRKH